MKNLLIITSLFVAVLFQAQVAEVDKELNNTQAETDDIPDGWYKAGTFAFLFNQSAFSNWLAGGSDNVGGNLGINYDFNYKKGKTTWDNRLVLAYGVNKLQGQDSKKTDDRIEFNSTLGLKAKGFWSYSFFFNLRTQFTDGYNYTGTNWKNFPTSGFFKPAYFTFGPGMLWKKSENLKFNIAPLTSKITYLNGHVYNYDKKTGTYTSSQIQTVYGVDPDRNMIYQLGLYASGYYKFDVMKNVSMENIVNIFSNYLDKPQNVDIDYTANIVMQINKYLAANLSFQTIYDDNAYPGFQVREVFGLGLNYNF